MPGTLPVSAAGGLPTLLTDFRHVFPVAAHGFAALAPNFTALFLGQVILMTLITLGRPR